MTPTEVAIDEHFLKKCMLDMLLIPSPTGFTNEISRYICWVLSELDIPYKLTRRGTIIAQLEGLNNKKSRAYVNHIDTIGATVDALNSNGRLGIAPIGSWSSRFAEGGRVTVFTKQGGYRGQVLPLLASGHAFNEAIDELPVSWNHVEVRVDEPIDDREDLKKLGFEEGDFVAFDSCPEFLDNGYIAARHLDNKAGAAALLTTLKYLRESAVELPINVQAIFTISEEIGTGAGSSLDDTVTEFIGIDIGPVAPGQNAKETGVTLCAQDTSGPFDRTMLKKLKKLCEASNIDHQIDVYRYYYSDANSAVIAGHDVKDALINFGTDATHGYERTHMNSLISIAKLLYGYSQSEPLA